MSCTCSKREPCPHHSTPLPICEEVQEQCYVVHLFCFWPRESMDKRDRRYFYTVTVDALQVHKSPPQFTTKREAFEDFLKGEWIT